MYIEQRNQFKEQGKLMKHRNTSKSFNFLDLDSRLNTKKIEQTKRQQKQKNILNIYQKKMPNFQLIDRCDKALKSYKDHYNINRQFSLFHQLKTEKFSQKDIKNVTQKDTKRLPSLMALKVQSSQNLTGIQRKKTLSLFEAEKVMKPIKSNQYLNKKGVVLLSEKQINPSISIQNRKQNTKRLEKPQVKSQRSKSYRIGSNLSQKSLQKNTQQDKRKQKLPQLKNQVDEKSALQIRIKRRKKLMLMFRRNVFLIIHKLNMMKLSFYQLLQNKIFDKSIPYKFGQQIFHSIKQGDEPKVFRIMIQKRLSIFSFDITGKTTLMWACIRGYDKIAQLLLSNGIQPHAQDMNGKTALYYAIKYNHLECAKIIFIFSYHLQEDLQKQNMTVQMRRMLRIGFSSHKFLKQFDSVSKKKEYFEHEYKYYFKE